MQDISFTVHTFKEGKMFVAYVPELDLSSCGATDEDARKNIRDAIRGFLETCAEMGTLAEILEEAGYEHEGETWRAPEFVSLDRLTMSVK
ncbi:MAG: type II toxin-antitoxin system HicB family antitoxin [Terriglobia bacterium]|jgi:predicted RNase H-like HicB family nuclease